MTHLTLLTLPSSPGMDAEAADRVVAKANELIGELNEGNVENVFLLWKDKKGAFSYLWTRDEATLAYVASLANAAFVDTHND